MTFAQLRSFATVARLGSVSAAADALGVSEPAVSSAVAALRRDLGDELFVRAGGGIRLTAGGERLAAAAAEILGLEDRLRREVGEARGERGLLRLAVSPTVAEYVSAPLLDAFTRRRPTLEVAQEVAAPRRLRRAAGRPPRRRRARAGAARRRRASRPCRSCATSSSSSPRRATGSRGARDVALDALRGERWLVGPGAARARAPVRRSAGCRRPSRGAFATEAARAGGGRGGRGRDARDRAHRRSTPLRRGTLVRLDVRGTPRDAHVARATLGRDRRSAVAGALRRFVTTPEATQAIVARPGGVPAGRFRPPVYVTIWSALEV